MKSKPTIIAAIIVAAVVLSAPNCGKFHERAEETLAASKAVIDDRGEAIAEKCKVDGALSDCMLVREAETMHNLAVEALGIYCSGPNWAAEDAPDDTLCEPPTEETARRDLELRVKETFARLKVIISYVKELK